MLMYSIIYRYCCFRSRATSLVFNQFQDYPGVTVEICGPALHLCQFIWSLSVLVFIQISALNAAKINSRDIGVR